MSTAVLYHIDCFNTNHATGDTIKNSYELPILARAVQYLHAAAGFPTKATWRKSIHNRNYLTWPLITVKNVNRHFPDSEETQKVHRRNQCQGVSSTKAQHPVTEPTPAEKRRNVFINLYDPKGTIYTYQTGNFSHRLSRGNKYKIILNEMYGNSTWIELIKNKTEGGVILSRSRALERIK